MFSFIVIVLLGERTLRCVLQSELGEAPALAGLLVGGGGLAIELGAVCFVDQLLLGAVGTGFEADEGTVCH